MALGTYQFIALALLAGVSVCGCSGQKFYYNNNYGPSEQQHRYNMDSRHCRAVSYGAIPNQQIAYNPYAAGFVGGFVNGVNMASAFGAEEERGTVYHDCMYQLGWFEVPQGYVAPAVLPSDIVAKYRSGSDHRALAQATSGAVGAAWGCQSTFDAIFLAMDLCMKNGGTDCSVVSIDGEAQQPKPEGELK